MTITMPSISDSDSVSETNGKRNMQLMFMNNISIKYGVSFKSGSCLLNTESFSYWREINILKSFKTTDSDSISQGNLVICVNKRLDLYRL